MFISEKGAFSYKILGKKGAFSYDLSGEKGAFSENEQGAARCATPCGMMEVSVDELLDYSGVVVEEHYIVYRYIGDAVGCVDFSFVGKYVGVVDVVVFY